MTVLERANTNSTRFRQIFSRLGRGAEYREHFVESEISVGIPFQIRAMREGRSWTQKELADRSGKRQSVISQLEDPGYGKLTLSTLRKLAAAFDVGLMVRFVPFSELVGRASNLSPADLNVPNFESDSGLERKASTGDEAKMLAVISSADELRDLDFLSAQSRLPAKRALDLTANTLDGSTYYERIEQAQETSRN